MTTQLIVRKNGELVLTDTSEPDVYDHEIVFTGNAVSTISIEDGIFVQKDNDGVGSRNLFNA